MLQEWYCRMVLQYEIAEMTTYDAETMLLINSLAEELKNAEINCLGWGGFHEGYPDEMTSHRNDAERLVTSPLFVHAIETIRQSSYLRGQEEMIYTEQETFNEWQKISTRMSDYIIANGGHPVGKHELPSQYDSMSGLACIINHESD